MRLLLVMGLLLLVAIASLPAVLRSIPSRYVARLPEPIQSLGAPADQGPFLPTVEIPDDSMRALLTAQTAAALAGPSEDSELAAPPPTPTAIPVVKKARSAVAVERSLPKLAPTPTSQPTAGPVPQTPRAARLEGFQHQFQTWNNCGPATMAMTLSYFGLERTQNQTAAVLKPDPEDRNVSPGEMVGYVLNETEIQAINRANGDLDTLRRLIANGIPVVLEIGIEPPGEYRWLGWYGHYLLVVAYDDDAGQLWVYDSWFGTSEEPLQNADSNGRALSYADLDEFWPQFNRNYIAFYRPEQEALVAGIIGSNMDDEVMWRNALGQARSDAAADPENAFYWFNMGTVYTEIGDYESAAAAFDLARTIGLPWRMMWYQFGPFEAYYQVGRYEDVILLADVTLQDRPYFEESYYWRGLAHAAQGDLDEARRDFERAVNFNPNFAPAANALNRTGG